MDGQQPGNIYTPGQSKDEQSETVDTGVTDEIAQIDSAVESNPVPADNLVDYRDSAPQFSESNGSTDGVVDTGTAQSSSQDLRAQTPTVAGQVNPATSADVSGDEQNELGSAKEPSLLLSWQSHGDKLDRGPQWYAVLFAVTITIAGLTLLATGSWMSAIVVVLAAAALIVVNTKGPNVQAYGIFDAGVQIEERFYGYDQLRSFSLSSMNGESLIELEPSKRFYPRITIHAGDFIDQAQELLSQFLPKNNREPDMIDKISQRLRL